MILDDDTFSPYERKSPSFLIVLTGYERHGPNLETGPDHYEQITPLPVQLHTAVKLVREALAEKHDIRLHDGRRTGVWDGPARVRREGGREGEREGEETDRQTDSVAAGN